jgi:hypothetical protein
MDSNVDTTPNEKATETVTEEPVARKPRKKKRGFLFLAVAAILLAALAFLERQRQSSETRAAQPVWHEPTMEVSVVHPEKVPETIPLELPGQTQAYTDAPIFAQTSGCLKTYAQATLKLTGNTGLFTIPSNAMLFRADGTAVGVVDPDGKVEIRKINIALNNGNTLQIAGGLSETDEVIVNPSDSLAAGRR